MFDKPNDNPKIVAKNLLMAMPYKEAQKFCVMKEIEARHKVEELSKRHMEEYLTARKELEKWRRVTSYISNTKNPKNENLPEH